MKILVDACVWGGTRQALRDAGHEVERVGDWATDPGDEHVLAHATEHGQVLLTLDKDFGELAVVHQQLHCGIVRLVKLRAEAQGPASDAILSRYGVELARGAIVTADVQRVRIRPPDSDRE